MSAIHHIDIDVSNFERSELFYDPILSWLGFKKAIEHTSYAGYVKDGFLLALRVAPNPSELVRGTTGIHHFSFSVNSREAVDRFYSEVLLKMAAVEIEDPPVDCPEYTEGYYATFFYDPDGIKLEVTHFDFGKITD